jgi:putative ABC transport system ATP-binding protein
MQAPNTLNPVPVFHARGLCKTYVMGEVEVHALRDVDLDIYERELMATKNSGAADLITIPSFT